MDREQEDWALRLPRGVSLLAVFGMMAAVFACSSSEFISGGPLDVQISADSAVAVGDSLELRYEVVGRSLLGMIVDWGDMGFDSLAFFGAQTAGGRVRHLYPQDGSFTISVRVEDQVDGFATQDVIVTVEP